MPPRPRQPYSGMPRGVRMGRGSQFPQSMNSPFQMQQPTRGPMGGPMSGPGRMGGPTGRSSIGGGKKSGGLLSKILGGKNNTPSPTQTGFLGNTLNQPAQRGGGLLSKILGGSNSAGNQAGIAASQVARGAVDGGGSTGGLLKALSNPESISSFLNNTQNMIRTAQSFGPMIDQYGPLVKNLPAMWKLYRGMKDMDDVDTTDTTTETTVDISKNQPKKNPSKKKKDKKKTSDSKTVKIKDAKTGNEYDIKPSSTKIKRSSSPKMYI